MVVHNCLTTLIAHSIPNSIVHPIIAIKAISVKITRPALLRPQSFSIPSTFWCIKLTRLVITLLIIGIAFSYMNINGCPIATKRFIINTTIINPITTFTKNPIRSGNTLYAMSINAHKPINSNILPPSQSLILVPN